MAAAGGDASRYVGSKQGPRLWIDQTAPRGRFPGHWPNPGAAELRVIMIFVEKVEETVRLFETRSKGCGPQVSAGVQGVCGCVWVSRYRIKRVGRLEAGSAAALRLR